MLRFAAVLNFMVPVGTLSDEKDSICSPTINSLYGSVRVDGGRTTNSSLGSLTGWSISRTLIALARDEKQHMVELSAGWWARRWLWAAVTVPEALARGFVIIRQSYPRWCQH